MKLVEREGALVAENAVLCGPVTLARGVSIWFGAVVRADLASITIGEYTNIQDGCILHTDPGKDLVIGRHVTAGHLAMIHAREIGDRCLIGIGSILLSGAVVGEGSIVAAGALVREDQVIPPRSLVVGLPGRIIGQVSEAQFEEAEKRALRYHELALKHVKSEALPQE